VSHVAFVIYRQVYEDGHPIIDQHDRDLGSRVALRVYTDRATVLARLAELMRVARRTTNPFAFYNTAGTPEVLALGVSWRAAPQAGWGDEELIRWYDGEVPHLTDEQREKVWSLFDAQPLFGIREVPLGDG